MKYLKHFKQLQQYGLFKDSEDFILPNVTYIVDDDIVLYNSTHQAPEQTFMLRAKYNATSDNLLAFNGASNVKSLKVNGTPITIEPFKNENTAFDVLGENISLDMETGAATLPDSYLIKSPASSWSFKAKDPNYVINENTFVCTLTMMDGMTFAEPYPLEEVMGYDFITNDGVTLEVTDDFLSYMNSEFPYGLQIGFILMDVDTNSGTFVFIDTEHQANITTGGLSTYSFDSEGLYDVEIELADPDMKDIQFAEISLSSIEIGDGITSIGEYQFEDCINLTSVTIGSGVTYIGISAFSGCASLPVIDNIRYADTYLVEATDKTLATYNIKEGTKFIGDGAFNSCSNLTAITIPDSVTYIGHSAFQDCSGLNSINIPDGVTFIGLSAFQDCTGLTGELAIPDGVTSISNNVFSNCSGLTSIIIPDSVTSIYHGAFSDCSGLTSINIPDSVTSIGLAAFSGCKGLTSIVIPDSVTSIDQQSFTDCTGLTSITIGSGVTSIGYSAFSGCINLTSITISSGVTSIGDWAFRDCSRLTSITCLAPTAPSISTYTFCNVPKGGTLYVPSGSNYSSWMSTGNYYLGKYNWTIEYI